MSTGRVPSCLDTTACVTQYSCRKRMIETMIETDSVAHAMGQAESWDRAMLLKELLNRIDGTLQAQWWVHGCRPWQHVGGGACGRAGHALGAQVLLQGPPPECVAEHGN